MHNISVVVYKCTKSDCFVCQAINARENTVLAMVDELDASVEKGV